MGWQEDLGGLLEDIQGAAGQGAVNFFTSPVGRPVAGALTSPVAQGIFKFMSLPLDVTKYGTGALLQGVNKAPWLIPGGSETLDPAMDVAFQQGGPRGAWEQRRSVEPKWFQLPTEVALDPVTYLSMGAGTRIGEAAGVAAPRLAAAGHPVLATGLRASGVAAEGAQFLWNDMPGKVILPRVKQAAGVAKGQIERVFPTAFDLAPDYQVRTLVEAAGNARIAERSATETGQAADLLAPLATTPTPPLIPSPHPPGSAPVRLYDQAVAAWKSMWAGTPESPGKLGIIKATSGPGLADAAPAFTEDEFDNMAKIGAWAMQRVDDDTNLFGGVRRAAQWAPAWRQEMIDTYGEKIIPTLPFAWERMRELHPEMNIPDARFALSHAYASETVSLARLDAAQKIFEKGGFTDEARKEAMDYLQKNWALQSPQAVEDAAAQGGALMSLYRQGGSKEAFREGGAYFPKAVTKVGGPERAVIPVGFLEDLWGSPGAPGIVPFDATQAGKLFGVDQTFGSNRAAWEAYVTKVYGPMQPDELDLLAWMSSNQLYNEYVNAANDYAMGAVKYAGGMAAAEKRLKGLKSSTRSAMGKKGIYAEAPTQRGAPEMQAILNSPGMIGAGSGGAIIDRDAWAEQLRQFLGQEEPITRADINRILGQRKTSELTEADLKAALEKLGQTPMQRNPGTGLLPNLQELFGVYEAGKNMPTVGGRFSPAYDWYGRGAREMAMLVGVGDYRKARLMLNLMALTSSSTPVEVNAENAIRALAEWDFGLDTELQQSFGLTGPQLQTLLNNSKALHADIPASQKAGLEAALNAAEAWRTNPNAPLPLVLKGEKQFQFAGSFLAPFWRDQLDVMAEEMPKGLGEQIKDSFKRFMNAYVIDRHQSRIGNGPTAVQALQMQVERERGILAARAVGLQPEEAQAAGWYAARTWQGFVMFPPESDVSQAIRNVVKKIWDTGTVDGETWDDMVARFARETPGLEGDALYKAIYDANNQEILHRAINYSLSKPAVQKALRDKGLSATFAETQNDVLGIAARGAHGLYPNEWPTPLGGLEVDQLRGVIDEVAAAPQPTMLQFSQGQWAPIGGAGYAVPIMDAGGFSAGQTQTARKRLEALLTKPIVADIFDPVGGDRSGQLAIGVIPAEGGTSRISLYAVTPDLATAELGARRAGAGGIVDLGTMSQLTQPVRGPRTKDLPGLLGEMFGPAPQLPRPSLDAARSRGITMAESDILNPVSILNRKFINPLMDRYEALTQSDGPEHLSKSFEDLGIPGWQGEVPEGYNPMISGSDNAALLRTVSDGRTYRQVIEEGATEGAAAQAALREAGVSYDPWAPLAERLRAANGDKVLQDLITDWHHRGIDPLYASNPDDIGLAMLRRQLSKDLGVPYNGSTTYDLMKSAWSEQVLTSPKYHTGNMSGNWMALQLQGVNMPLDPREYWTAWKATRRGVDDVTRQEALDSLKITQTFKEFGLDAPPADIFRGGIRGISANRARSTPSAMGELVERLTGSQRAAKVIGSIFVFNNDMATAEDVVARSALMGETFKRRMEEMLPAWDEEVRKAAAGIPGFEWDSLQKIGTPAGGMYAGAIKATLMDAGLDAGTAEHLVRAFVNMRGVAIGDGREAMNKALFTYSRTNLDQWIGKFVPFHYWYSRALRYYGEESLRHPALILNYMRAQNGIEQAQDDPGLSARQKGFLRLFGTPLGFSLLMNPDALFGVVKVFGMQDSYEPDGQTSLGGAIQWLKDRGLGLYPWIDGVLNLMGIYGSTFEPDLLGIRHKAIVGSAINFVRAHAGFEPGNAPYMDAMGQLRYSVSSFVDSFTPDWIAQTVTPRAGNSSQEASLDTMIENVILSNNPQLTNGQLLEIMADPDSPEYAQAYRQVADAGIVAQLLNFTAPVTFQLRHDARDVRLAEMNTIYEAAQKAGVSPYEFAPTPQDVAFKAKYRNLTGKDWQPGDYASAKLLNDLARAPTEQKGFILDEALYQDLGTPRQQALWDQYQALRYGDDPRTVGMTEDARRAYASAWADTRKRGKAIDEMYALRDTFTSTHPEFAAFTDWQRRVRSLAGMYGGTLAEYRRRVIAENPNAARYFAEQEVWIRANVPQEQWDQTRDQITTNAGAYAAITGRAMNRQAQGPVPGVPRADITLPNMLPAPPPPDTSVPMTDWQREAAGFAGRYGNTPYGGPYT